MSRPDFTQAKALIAHIDSTLAFYRPNVFDPQGGFFQHFRDNGSIYDANTRHLVSSTRFVFNYACAVSKLGKREYLAWVEHGIAYLKQVHRTEYGYVWLLDDQGVQDDTNHCYGLAFVMVAGATALLAGVEAGRELVEDAWGLMEQHFWSEADGLYADEANADFSVVGDYRGQNANMHACEAMLWAFEATGEQRFLQRAYTLAQNMCVKQAALGDGLIWEHYDRDWQIDWDYNRDNPKHLFRPWGFQTGHQTEWAKLLLILHRFKPEGWMVDSARRLFDRAIEKGWDHEFGGLVYGFDPEGRVCDDEKYFWVQAESLAAAWLLYRATGEAHYMNTYNQLWDYAWAHMIDHEYGAWFRIRSRDNQALDDLKSPAGKTDYHTMGACYEVLRNL